MVLFLFTIHFVMSEDLKPHRHINIDAESDAKIRLRERARLGASARAPRRLDEDVTS